MAFWLHTGNRYYSVLAFTIALLANLVMDEKSADDTINSISEGDLVEYRVSDTKTIKCEYRGLYKGDDKALIGRYVFYNNQKKFIYILPENLYKITPYNGNAQTLTSVGIGKKTSMRVKFLMDVVGLSKKDISSIPGMSTVIYIREDELDDILSKTSICVNNQKYMVKDLARVTYYTATNEHRKAGNASNNEPAIKASYNIDRIHELVRDNQETEIFGFLSLDSSIYKRYSSDFEMLLNRKKLTYSWLVSKYEYSEWINGFLDEERENLYILPYSRGFLTSMKLKSNAEYSDSFINELQVVRARKVDPLLVDNEIKWKDYRRVKNKLKFIMNNSKDIDDVLSFSRWAYSVLKLYNNAIFTIEEYENNKILLGKTLKSSIVENEKRIEFFSNAIKQKAIEVVDYIKEIYDVLYDKNDKVDVVRDYISEGDYKNVLFVVANNTYVELLKNIVSSKMQFKNFNYKIVTESKVDELYQGGKYDLVIYTSLMNYEQYNPYNNTLASKIIVLLYDSQIRTFNRVMNNCMEFEKKISGFTRNIKYVEDNNDIYEVEEDDYYLDKEFKDYFVQAFIKSDSFQDRSYSGDASSEHFLEAYKYGQFSDGEQIIFTKNYIAYVLDDERGAVEKKIDEVKVGDPVYLTRNYNKAKQWVRKQVRGSQRSGVLACSSAQRLKPEGIFVPKEIDVKNWFLAPSDDLRSSNMLEVVASEFKVQGLEIDWAVVCWDADLRRNASNKNWDYYNFRGTKWVKRNQEEQRRYLLNSYRVLLTRARQGMVIFVPEGVDEEEDPTRNKKFYDDIYTYLLSCGISELPL